MDPPKKYRLKPLEMQILEVLWSQGEISPFDIYTQFDKQAQKDTSFTVDYRGRDQGSAGGPSSITSERELRIMELRGLVANRGQGTHLLYHALVRPEAVTLSVGDHLVNRMGTDTVPTHLFDSAQKRRPSARLRQLGGDGED